MAKTYTDAELDELIAKEEARLENERLDRLIAEAEAKQAKEEAGVSLATPSAAPSSVPVPGTVGFQEDIVAKAREAAASEAKKRLLPSSEEEGLFLMKQQEEERRRARSVSAGGAVGPASSPLGDYLPFLRETRIDEQGLYLDPDTKERRPPTDFEALTETFARQPVMTESQALTAAAERQERLANPEQVGVSASGAPVREVQGVSALKNILSERVPGRGVYETAGGALSRSVPGWVSQLVAEPIFGGLGREVDPSGRPVDPGEFGVFDVQRAEGYTPFGADPEGRRAAGSQTEDLAQRMARGVSSGRTLGEELASTPALVQAAKDATGENEEYAKNTLWAAGTVAEIFLPSTPFGLAGEAGELGARGAKAGARMGVAALDAATPSARLGTALAQKAEKATAAAAKGLQDTALLGTIAKKNFPDVASDIPHFASEDEVVEAVQRGRAAIEARPLTDSEVRATLRANVPDDYVQVTRSFAAPKSKAAAIRDEIAQKVRSTDGRKTPQGASDLADEMARELYTYEGTRTGLAKLDDLTTRSMDPTPIGAPRSFFDNMLIRNVKAFVEDSRAAGALPDSALLDSISRQMRASSFRIALDLRDELIREMKVSRQAAENAYRTGLESPGPAKPGGIYVDAAVARIDAVDTLLKKYAPPDSEVAEALFDNILEDALGEVAGVRTQEIARQAARTIPRDPSKQVSVIGLARYAVEVARRMGKPSAGPIMRGVYERTRLTPLILTTILEDGVRKSMVREGMQQAFAAQGSRPPRYREITSRGEFPIQVPGRTRLTDSWVRGPEDLIRPGDMFQPEPLIRALSDSAGVAWDQLWGAKKRLSLYLNAGFSVIPNVPVWFSRFIRAALTSTAQLGLEAAGTAAVDTIRILNAKPNARLFVGADGVVWTRRRLGEEGRRLGLGVSAQDMARQGQLDRDLAARALRIARPTTRDKLFPEFIRMAGELSDSYRMGVFAGALRKGYRAEDAADMARRSLLDYSTTPPFITQTIGRYMAAAAETWEGFGAVADAFTRRPGLPGRVFRIQTAMNRLNDPYGRQGDASRRALVTLKIGDGPDAYTLLGPQNPIGAPVESLISILVGLDQAVLGAKDVVEKGGVLDGFLGAVGAGAEIAARAVSGELAPEDDILEPVLRDERAHTLSDAEMFGILWSLVDEDSGQYPELRGLVDKHFPREGVKPPAELAADRQVYGEGVWVALPSDWREQGLVWAHLSDAEMLALPDAATQEAAASMVRVWRPTAESKRTLKALRALAPSILEETVRIGAGSRPEAFPQAPVDTNIKRIGAEALTGKQAVDSPEALLVERFRQVRAGE